jgi:hypothetical protein
VEEDYGNVKRKGVDRSESVRVGFGVRKEERRVVFWEEIVGRIEFGGFWLSGFRG